MNKELVLRLAKYRRLLYKLKNLGLERVFSNNLGDAIGVTPALVRKDFSMINLTGNKRGGYNIDAVIQSLDDILGQSKPKEIILVGCGKIGTALMENKEFERDGITIAAGFDIDPSKVHTTASTPIYHVDQLEKFSREHEIHVGIIAVPDTAATQVLDKMIDSGISGILNFAPVELKCSKKCDRGNCPTRCNIQNVNIALEIENLFYLENLRAGETIEQDVEIYMKASTRAKKV
ncbi:MAG TPA: redox-sensing transcriptional repressor Rex [Spirochaetia bacterium]|nr:redox-sensing transcriptional repressor Rex [Spirochaetia bacterium]